MAGPGPATRGGVPASVRAAARAQALATFRRLPVDPTLVVWESFAGNGMLCNPEALYHAVREDQRFARLTHVWVLDDPDRHPAVVAQLAQDARTRVVTRRSLAYFRALATAGFLVNNATFPAEFAKRTGQTYLNTWHGTPWKHMGYDVPGGALPAANIVRNFLQADYLLSASPYMTEQLYAAAYKMRGILPGRVLEEGHPRMDRQMPDRESARAELAARGQALATDRVVLYAPTWRGGSFHDPRDDSALVGRHVRRLRELLGPAWTVLLKVHQAVYGPAQAQPGLGDLLVDNDIPANLVLAACDVLVADYSSLIVDFLALDRPVVLHAPDRDEYRATRGLYQPAPGDPGPVHADIALVAESVAAAGTGGPDDPQRSHAQARARWREVLCPHDDGRASQRVADVVFGGRREGHRLVDLPDSRRRMLIYVGELAPNGMTSSALNLLRALDHERYDVTALFPFPSQAERVAGVGSLDPRVRALARLGGGNESLLGAAARQVVQRRGVSRRRGAAPLASAMRDEWERCLGQARFDTVVDFIGYSPFWDLLLLQGRARHTAVWLHNDMVADSLREVGGRQPLRRSLRAVFSTYRFFDSLVSVSPALRDVNRARLAGYAPAQRFTCATNVVDAESIRARAAEEPAWRPPAAPAGTRTFVGMGRLSSAKNFPRLISAFAQVHAEHPATALVILGEGPDRGAIERHIDQRGLRDAVHLAGQQPNPFPIVAAADCFVMSSDHEGQPMVLLEALVLGLPVVTTRFASVDSALPTGAGLVVPRTVEGVAEGMAAFLRGEVPRARFDPEGYNRSALRQFLAATGLDQSDDRGGAAG